MENYNKPVPVTRPPTITSASPEVSNMEPFHQHPCTSALGYIQCLLYVSNDIISILYADRQSDKIGSHTG